MRNDRLLTGVATLALIVSGSAAFADPVNIGDIDQSSGNYGNVANGGFMDVDSLAGLGASAAISATGAAASASVSEIASDGGPLNLSVGDVEQNATNGSYGNPNGITILNFGDMDQSGDISGDGASLSVSATGAVSAVSASFIHSPAFDQISIATGGGERVEQTATNGARVVNINSPTSNINTHGLSGDGASIGVSATGSAAVASLTSIQNYADGRFPDVDTGNFDQTSSNSGSIFNFGGSVETDDISGDGASVSIGATGAVAAVSVTSIRDAVSINSLDIGNIDQNVTNHGGVANIGSISSGNITGDGSSTSVAATGAVAAASITDVSSIGGMGQVDVGNVTQSANNYATVANGGSINVGTLSGHGSSAGISATGAAAAVSVSTIK